MPNEHSMNSRKYSEERTSPLNCGTTGIQMTINEMTPYIRWQPGAAFQL